MNMRKTNDIIAGFIVFLIALPLSLGIAMASGVPPISGLIAAIVGGIFVSGIRGGHVSINGAAAGLIVVVLHGAETLGRGDPMAGYRALLAAVVVSGVILAIAGKLKAGRLGDSFPSSAVHGMLAAIGVIIIAKQFHIALGVSPDATSTLGLIAEIPRSLQKMDPEVITIGLSSLLILIGLPLIQMRWAQRIPAPMVAVLVGIFLGRVFDLEHEHTYLFLEHHAYTIGPKFLVSLPDEILQGITFPDFSQLLSLPFLGVVFSLTMIQGLETMLSASAVDRFDPKKRVTDLDKDLFAVGAGTAISGILGGLPIIAEIVRSRANVSNGAQTSWSNFYHGLFMLAFVVFAPGLIHQIPLACLAAILMVTGYRLASPSQFKHTLKIGPDQLLVFSSTLAITVATDLLVGVTSGIVLEVVVHVVRGFPPGSLLRSDVKVEHVSEGIIFRLKKGALFTNYLGIKRKLDSIPKNRKVVVDLSEADFIDHTVMEKLAAFAEEYRRSGGSVELLGLDALHPAATHPLASRRRSQG